ncbi:MAG: hypothetical protein C4551_03225 [Bacillota bacterium]|nr:MAG: hypothetical protein C4551_03225 [Bacillota bacterium]
MLLDEIGTWLVERGIVGGTTGWTLAKGYMPPTPDRIVALFDTGGTPASPSADQPTFQLRVRAARMDYPGTRAKAWEAFNALQKLRGELSGVGYESVTARQLPFPMGYDTNDRPEFACNLVAVRLR